MPFRGPLLWLRDIVAAIADIRNFTTGMNALAFREDRRTLAAVERKLQVISEAATRLGDDAERLCPGMPWRNIRGIGNWLRHQHDHVDADSIWERSSVTCHRWRKQ